MNLSAFRTRILGGAVATAVLAVLLVHGSVYVTLQFLFPHEVEVSDSIHEACEAAPETWTHLRAGHMDVRAFDGTGVALDGQRLELDGAALPGDVGGSLVLDGNDARELVVRLAEDGPCAVVALRAGPPRAVEVTIPWVLAASSFLAMLLVGLGSYRFTVVPLMRRVGGLRDAAVEVGDSERYRSADDDVDDALAQIGGVLDASHERIMADKQELVARHQALETYMAELAHDLRTPLGSLLLALQELHASGEEREVVKRALQDTDYVSTLVENLHHAARLRHGLDATEGRVDLVEVVSRLEVRFRALGQVAGVSVAASVPDAPVMVQCTPALAERALANLVQNALAHGGEHVALLLTVPEEGRFEVTILDDGEGLPSEQRADLAKRTFVDDPARRRGPGLGVAITNEVVARVGWSIAYEEASEGGLAVRIRGGCVDGSAM